MKTINKIHHNTIVIGYLSSINLISIWVLIVALVFGVLWLGMLFLAVFNVYGIWHMKKKLEGTNENQ